MTRQTKVGLLIALAVILVVGIVLTDHLSVAQKREPPELIDYVRPTEEGMLPPVAMQLEFTPEPDPPRAPVSGPPVPSGIAAQLSQGPPITAREPSTLEGNTGQPGEQEPVPTLGLSDPPPEPRTEMQTAAATAAAPRFHLVAPGKTLWEIAQIEYGNGSHWRRIKQANAQLIRDSDHLVAGWRLRIPPPQRLADHPDFRPATAGEALELGRPSQRQPVEATITVTESDTFSSLAAVHLGSSRRWDRLFEHNRRALGINEPEQLQPGMVLSLPSNRKPVTARPPAEDAAPTDAFYVVAASDTLSSIAARLLHDRRQWRLIFEANRDRLANPDALPVGVKLRIPQIATRP